MRYIILLLFIPISGYSQKIKTEIYKFTNEKIIKTGFSNIRPTLSAPLSIKIQSTGKETIYLSLSGANFGANIIGADATATFLLEDKTTITIHSIGVQGYDIGQYGRSYTHHYRISVSDFKVLFEHQVISIRKSDGVTYHDFDIEKKNAEKFKKLQLKFWEKFDNQ